MDTRTSMGVIGDMNKFQAFQMGNAMTLAADNPGGGGASEGMGLGMGFAMANRMMQAPGMMQAPSAGGMAAPPPVPTVAWHVAVNGQTEGPFNDQQLVERISSGKVTQQTTVWNSSLSGWTPAGNVPQLANYFQASAPPPPPPA